MFNHVRRTDLNSIKMFRFWYGVCPKTVNPLISLYYKSLYLQGCNWRRLNVTEGRFRWTLSLEIITNFCSNFDFVPPMAYDAKSLIWHTYVLSQIFSIEQKIHLHCPFGTQMVDNTVIPLMNKARAYFSLQVITRWGKSLCMPLIAILIKFFSSIICGEQLIICWVSNFCKDSIRDKSLDIENNAT